MKHTYEWKAGGRPAVRVLELPEPAGATHDEGYPVRGPLRLEYRKILKSRPPEYEARLRGDGTGAPDVIWCRRGIRPGPGTSAEDAVMKAYLAWARREQEKATALFIAVQTAWDHLHPDEFPDHP